MPNPTTEINPPFSFQASLRCHLLSPAGLHPAGARAVYDRTCDSGLDGLLPVCWDYGLTELYAREDAGETRVVCTTQKEGGESLEIRITREAVTLIHPAGSGTVLATELKRDPDAFSRLRWAAVCRLRLPF